MADIYGGRVLAGEDSEEDDEDEEEMSFQFNGFGSQSSPAAPRFAAPTVVAPSAGDEGEESDEEEDELKEGEKSEEKNVEGEEDEEDDDTEQDSQVQDKSEKVESPQTDQPTVEASEKTEKQQELWQVDASVNGIEVMSSAVVDTLQPSLDATIHRIAELKESQQRLLKMLTEQNTSIKSNKQLEDAAVVLEKLPYFVKKVQSIKLAMQEIATSTEKMKRRAEGLRIDAQSHAIKKENKRDAQSQWNKLCAAKSAPGSTQS